MAPDLGRYLEDDKLVGPGGEPALAPELAGLLRDRQERVSCRLIGQILQFRAGNPHPRPAPRSLTTGGPQQHRVQLRQRRFSSRAIIGKRLQPSGRVGIKPRSRGNPVPTAVRGRRHWNFTYTSSAGRTAIPGWAAAWFTTGRGTAAAAPRAGDQCGLASEFGCHRGKSPSAGRVFPDTTIETARTPPPLR
jgi:hypothetical protein